MIQKIALIGRQNVGKSTLFNKLTKTKDALVINLPGVTRDRRYGKIMFSKKKITVIDTGGIDTLKTEINNKINAQSLTAIKEANIVFFIVDAKSGVTQTDINIKNRLKKIKNLYLIINKIDKININFNINDFRMLGIEKIYTISALYGRGIKKLIKKIYVSLKEKKIIDNSNQLKNQICYNSLIKKEKNLKNQTKNFSNVFSSRIKVALIGQPNSGKSTLINQFLKQERVIVDKLPGTTRDSISINTEKNGYKYTLIDTAGIRKTNKVKKDLELRSVEQTFQSIKNSHLILFIINALNGISNQDLTLVRFILNSGRIFIPVINKWDCINENKKKEIFEKFSLKLNFINFEKIHFISALYNQNVQKLFQSIHKIYKQATKKINTSLLTNTMRMAIKKHPHPIVQGKKIKINYVHIGNYRPFVLVIHGNFVSRIKNFYQKYLLNFLQKNLNIKNIKIYLKFKDKNLIKKN